MQRICVDMDEVMADTLAEHLRRYNQEFDEDVTLEDLAGKGLWEFTPTDRQAAVARFSRCRRFFRRPAPDARRAAGAEGTVHAL